MRGSSSRPGRRGRQASVLAASFLAMTGPIASARGETVPDPPLPGTVNVELVTRGIVNFPSGTFHWRILERSLVAGDPPTPAPEPAAMILVKSGTIDVQGSSSFQLAVGEAAMFGTLPVASLSSPDGASYWILSIYNIANSGGPGATGGDFTVGQMPREVHLVRGTLDVGEQSAIPDYELPILVLAADGTVSVSSSEGGDSAEFAAGQSDTFDGALTFTAPAETATFVAAVLGPPITDDGQGGSNAGPAPVPTPTPVPSPVPPTPTEYSGPSQTITFPAPGESHEWPDNTVVLQATASSGLPVSYRIVENEGGVCELDGSTISAEQPGGCTIIASQPGRPGEFDAAPDVSRQFYVGVSRLKIEISVPGTASASASPAGVDVTVVVSAPSGNRSFAADLNVEATGDCTLDAEGFAEVTGPGTHSFTVLLSTPPEGDGLCTIDADAQGQYAIGQPATVSFTVTA